ADTTAFEESLRIASSKHDIVSIRLYDPREAELPDVGIVEMKDAETGAGVWVDTSSRRVRESYAEAWRERTEEMERLLRRCRVDVATVATDEDYVKSLIKLFKRR
ncbi:MAG: DUF58 domain-containing protein, partial [Tidjanibacter sp.]|nr:DUF58 domain-containing protein [Tidjanibacter sp.]